MKFLEQFEVENKSARPVAFAANGSAVAYENRYNRGSAIIFGTFAGQQNYKQPTRMHPLGGILAKWAGLSEPKLQAPALLELRQMNAEQGRLVFFFNHAETSAQVAFSRDLAKPASKIREIVTGEKIQASGPRLALRTNVPAQSVRIYRIDY
jgi:hypothetical protein